MINNWNNIITDDDIVYHVGDITMAHEHTRAFTQYIVKHLKGHKHLIRGNHDDESDQFYLDCGFESVQDHLVLGDHFICHYPCYESKWTTKEEKPFIQAFKDSGCKDLIHGHVHNKDPDLWEPDGVKRINVCVDFEPNNFHPIAIEV
jgi:calcineurin-like phosphoesterase family protein